MDQIFQEQTFKTMINGAVYHAKCYSHFYYSDFKRAEKSLAILQFYREYLDVDKIIKNWSSMDAERLVPNKEKVLHPADRMVLSL